MRLYFKLAASDSELVLPSHLAMDTVNEVYSCEIEDEDEHQFIIVNDQAMLILMGELEFNCYSYSADLSAIDPAELEEAPF